MLDDDKRLTPELTIRIGVSVAAALDAAHQTGLVHRDIKPGNILITPQGRVLLTDFGIAKASSGDGDLTSDNVMMGTAKYLSPSRSAAAASTAGRTSTRSAWCSTSASPGECRSRAATTPRPHSPGSSATRRRSCGCDPHCRPVSSS